MIGEPKDKNIVKGQLVIFWKLPVLLNYNFYPLIRRSNYLEKFVTIKLNYIN